MAQARRQSPARRRLPAAGLSVAVHAAILVALVSVAPAVQREAEPAPIQVQLVPLPRPPEPPAPPQPDPEPAKGPVKAAKVPPPPKSIGRPPKLAPPPVVLARAPDKGVATDAVAELTDAETASAGTAESGGGGGSGNGGSCNMTRWIQDKLRHDRLVHASVAEVERGRPLLVWNGGWVRHPDQDGSGLKAVRESIIWEVAFAPVACRNQPVKGLVVLSLAEGPGAPRIALGNGAWRWSDLLGVRR